MSDPTIEIIDESILGILKEIKTNGVGYRNSNDIEMSILITNMKTQRAILNELILIRETLEKKRQTVSEFSK